MSLASAAVAVIMRVGMAGAGAAVVTERWLQWPLLVGLVVITRVAVLVIVLIVSAATALASGEQEYLNHRQTCRSYGFDSRPLQ